MSVDRRHINMEDESAVEMKGLLQSPDGKDILQGNGNVKTTTSVYSSSYKLTLALVVHLTQLHIILMTVSIPIIMCVPNGCVFKSGNLRMISDGFKANSALSTALWGAGIAWVTSIRYLGIVNSSIFYASIAHLCVPIATYTAFLTLRYDTLQDFHVVFATMWIVSSFTLHFCVTLNGNGNKQVLSTYIFGVGAMIGTIFVLLFIGVQVGNNASIDSLAHAVEVNDVQLLSAIAIFEVLTVMSLMFLDFQLCGQILDSYMGGKSIFQLVSGMEFYVYRIPLRIGILSFYVFLLVFAGISITRML